MEIKRKGVENYLFPSGCRWAGETSPNLCYTFTSDVCCLKKVNHQLPTPEILIDARFATTPATKDRSKTVTNSYKYTSYTWKCG